MKKSLSISQKKLQATWSPEQIANTPCELKMPCLKTIYRWLYEGYVAKSNVTSLKKKGKTKKSSQLPYFFYFNAYLPPSNMIFRLSKTNILCKVE